MATAARRGHGEGSVYRDAANGTWVGAISLGWRPDGARIRRKVTGRTKTEVRDKLKKPQAEADARLKTSASYTVAKAVDDWAAEALDGLRPVITTGAGRCGARAVRHRMTGRSCCAAPVGPGSCGSGMTGNRSR